MALCAWGPGSLDINRTILHDARLCAVACRHIAPPDGKGKREFSNDCLGLPQVSLEISHRTK